MAEPFVGRFGIVGTVVLRGKSAVVWFGWGGIKIIKGGGDNDLTLMMTTTSDASDNDNDDDDVDDEAGTFLSSIIGNGMPPMGHLALSMPPPPIATIVSHGTTTTQNKDDVNIVVSSTQLLGGLIEDDIVLSRRISVRLASCVGWPIFVSFTLLGGHGVSAGDGAENSRIAIASLLSAVAHNDNDDARQHVAALAEREVSCILLHEDKITFSA
ncbi:hypothetical protein ACHAW5_003054 [Stephanodiscus triporus]|uniref:Proteasome assembly chaperone 3 n=1 Tax=Stephanodiscus triporus TaxID=2934178 RepID=A0ABD3NMD1_9STRA